MLAPLIAAVSLAAFPTQEVQFPKKGEAWVSKVTHEFFDPETGELEQSFTYRVEKKVAEQLRGGLVIESKRTMLANRIGDTDAPLPPGLEPLTEKYGVDIYGLRLTVAEGERQQQDQRFSQLTDILCPERIGANESNAFRRGMEGSDTPKHTRLEFSNGSWDKEKKTFKCVLSVSDTGWPKPIEATGEAVFPEDSAIPILITLSAKGVEMPGGSGDLYTLRVKMVREEKKG